MNSHLLYDLDLLHVISFCETNKCMKNSPLQRVELNEEKNPMEERFLLPEFVSNHKNMGINSMWNIHVHYKDEDE